MDLNELLSFTIAGLSTAAIFAVIASGLVLTYTTTGVFNFAHGAVGMLAAFAYWQLHIGWGWPLVPSVAVVLFVAAPVFGLAFELVMRGLAGTSETLRFVVTVSLMFGIIGVAQAIWNPDTNRSVKQFFPGDKIDLGPTNITIHQLITIIVAIGVAIGLRLLLYGTRIGVAMRAAVDDRVLTQLNGARTVRVQQLSWVISTVLAAVGGVLVASVAGLNAIVMSLLIVNAYAAAIFGRLRSLPLTFLGAVVVGLTDGYLQGYLPDNPYVRGLRLASPVLVLFLVLLLIPNPRLSGHKGTREYFPAPSVEGMGIFCVVVVLVGVAMATTLSPPDLVTYGKIFPFAIIALSLVPLVGFANQISLCQLSFAGIGAVVMAHHGQGGNPLGLVAAAAVAALVGAIVALPALRLSGIYLALATAAFAVALDRWIFDLQDFHVAVHDVSVLGVVVAAFVAGAVVATFAVPALRAYTRLLTVGGLAMVVTVFLIDRSVFELADFSVSGQQDVSLFRQGALGVDRLDLFGWELDTSTEQMILSATVLAIVSAGVAAVRRGRFGRRLIALRDSEAACATFGIGIISSRVAVFAFSAGIAGLGGALLGMQLTSVQRADFEFVQGLPIFFLVVVGGAGFVSAGLSAGMFLYGMFPFTTAVASWYTKWQGLTAGFVGVTAGIEPSGSAPQFRNGFRHLIDNRGLKYGTIVALVLVWLGRLAELYDNWPFVLATIGVFFGCTGIGEVLARRRGEAPSWVRPANQARWRDRRSGAVRLSTADLERDLGLAEPIAELTAAGELSVSPLLDVRDVTMTFGGRRALDNVSVAAEPGSITGLIGPNGAGKTTCFNAICGLLQPNAGSIRLDGVELGHLSPTKRARQGLARTFQRLEMFTMLSTRDNVRVAVEGHRSWSRKREPVNARVDELLAKVGLSEVGERRVTDLSTGQGRMLEIARALACHPRVLLLDEPAAGQDESETERFAGLLRELVAGGMAVLMVEHDMRLVMGECHSVTVLDAGRIIASGTPEEVRLNRDVQAAYLGDEVA